MFGSVVPDRIGSGRMFLLFILVGCSFGRLNCPAGLAFGVFCFRVAKASHPLFSSSGMSSVFTPACGTT